MSAILHQKDRQNTVTPNGSQTCLISGSAIKVGCLYSGALLNIFTKFLQFLEFIEILKKIRILTIYKSIILNYEVYMSKISVYAGICT